MMESRALPWRPAAARRFTSETRWTRSVAVPLVIAAIALLAAPRTDAGPTDADSSASRYEQAHRDIEGLGATSFPNSGAADAQDAFYRGVLLLHSFEYGPAAEAFRRAQSLDADFALAYWGEAMTYNHPIWREFDRERARTTLERLAPTRAARRAAAGTEREAMYLDAIETLVSVDGPKAERDRAYMAAMRALHEAHPDDDEAAAFYALSILGSANGTRDFATYMRAAAVALPVFDRNPRHPGAAHYIIHAFDDPIHAPLGLPAANAYADIAPDAAHAQHMTSHIFLALGMWDDTVAANRRALATQSAGRAEPNVCGHYSSWLHYGYLQLGELEQAASLMDRCYERVRGDATIGEWHSFAAMRARHVVDTGDWDLVERWSVPASRLPDGENAWGYGTAAMKYRITDALAGLHRGDAAAARALLARPRPDSAGVAFQLDAVAGLLAVREGNTSEGLELLQDAAAAEDALPLEFGPPEAVQPSHELLGRVLLELDRRQEAAAAYRRAAERTPGRRAAVGGLDRVRSASARTD